MSMYKESMITSLGLVISPIILKKHTIIIFNVETWYLMGTAPAHKTIL